MSAMILVAACDGPATDESVTQADVVLGEADIYGAVMDVRPSLVHLLSGDINVRIAGGSMKRIAITDSTAMRHASGDSSKPASLTIRDIRSGDRVAVWTRRAEEARIVILIR